MKRKCIVTTLVFTILTILNIVPAYAADATVYSQIDTAAIPYQVSPNTYLINSNAVLTWKKYNNVLGYNDAGTQKASEATVEVYENRQGDTIDGSLNYSWTLDGNLLQPINDSNKGPINLGITVTPSGDLVTVAFSTTRIFDGTIQIKLNVSSYFKDGDTISLSYIDGVDTSQVHGTDTSGEEEKPYTVEGLTVQNGMLEFDMSWGGNYTLVKNADVIAAGSDLDETDAAADEKVTDRNEMDPSVLDDTKDMDNETSLINENKVPDTGSGYGFVFYGVAIILTGTCTWFLRKKEIQ